MVAKPVDSNDSKTFRTDTKAFLRELNAQRDAYRQEAVGDISTFFRRRERKPPEVFQNSSYLYIRSHEMDTGVRPLSNALFWNSPDITISPISSVASYTTELNAGDTYVIRCALRNRGDLAVPSAKIELFLAAPSIGFDTRFAANLTLGQVPSAWVPSNGSAVADFVYTVPATEAGHKCLFARSFSFSPLERPIDLFGLSPVLDRHTGQKNLNILDQSQGYSFNVVQQSNSRILLSIQAMSIENLLRLNHPVLAEFKPHPEPPRGELVDKMKVENIGDGNGITLERSIQGILVASVHRGAPSIVQQREVQSSVRKLLTAIENGKATRKDGRNLFQEYTKLTQDPRQTQLRMTVPDFGLRHGQAMGLNIIGTDHGLDPPQAVGGITLVVVQR